VFFHKCNTLVALSLVVLPVSGCSKRDSQSNRTDEVASAKVDPGPAQPTAAPEPPAQPPALNVLMLTLDSFRADMPWAGYSRPIAPNLSKYAEQGALYTRAYSVASYTAQSVVTWVTGQYASTLYRTGVFFTSYSKANTFFPEVLQADGVKSLGWFSHLYFGRGKGIERGFSVWELVPGITFDPQTDNYVTSDKMYDLGVKILGDSANTSGQFFAWAHFGDPHDQYIKHKESPDFGNKNRDRYDSEVWYADHYVGKLIDWAKTQPWWSRTIVILSGDHGEAFGEHGQFRHAFELWEPLVRVPLIIMGPGIAAKHIDALRSQIDLAPTIMDLLGKKPLPQFAGKSLVPELQGREVARSRDHIELELTEDTNNPQRRALIAGDYKLLVRGYDEAFLLFNLANDPAEEHDLSKSEPDKLMEMKAFYKEAFSKIHSVKPFGGMKLVSGKMADGTAGPLKK